MEGIRRHAWRTAASDGRVEWEVEEPLGSEMTIDALYVRGRPNSLNLFRLILASLVIVWHSFSVLGYHYEAGPLSNLLGSMPVNGFFVVSGFLIYRSWVNKPLIGSFLVARIARIYPAFWVCLILTATIFAPLAVALQGGDAIAQAFSAESFGYVWNNATLVMLQWTIGSTPAGVPWTASWNASLWTLAWEFLCYLGLMAFGLLGMARRRWLLPVIIGLSALLIVITVIPALQIEALARLGRFGLYFFVGALFAQHAGRIVIRRSWVLVALALVVAAAWIPGAALVQAPASGYALLGLGGLLSSTKLELRNDISYGVYIYAFPVQQLLVVAGLESVPIVPFSIVALLATLPLAIGSWFLIEKPALKFRKLNWSRKTRIPTPTVERRRSR